MFGCVGAKGFDSKPSMYVSKAVQRSQPASQSAAATYLPANKEADMT